MGGAVSYTLVHKRSSKEGLSGQKGVSKLSVPAPGPWAPPPPAPGTGSSSLQGAFPLLFLTMRLSNIDVNRLQH